MLALFVALTLGASDPVLLRVATAAPQGTPWESVLERFKRDLTATGKIKVKISYGGARGTEPAMVQQLVDGDLDMVAVTTAALSKQLPALDALELPFLFDSTEEADFVLDKYLTEPVAARAREHGMVFQAWYENGWQNFATTRKPVTTPKDLVGLKMRSQPSSTHMMAWQTFGAVPVPLEPNEVQAAIKIGKIDGFAQTIIYMLAAGWQTNVHHMTLSKHLYQPCIVVYARKFFDAQSAEMQKLLLSNAQSYSDETRKSVRAMDADLLATVQKQGLAVHTLSRQDRDAFVTVARRVQNKFVNTAPSEAMELLNIIVKGKAEFSHAKP